MYVRRNVWGVTWAHQRLDPEPPHERRRDQYPRISDRAIIIEHHIDRVQRIVHHMGDLPSGAAAALYSRFLPA
jgi:hypothetical protein